MLLKRREHIDDALDRAGSVVSVQCGKDEMPRLGGSENSRHRLQVSHLSDENHVRILTQRMAQRGCKGERVRTYLTLIHYRVAMRMHELDWILHRHDVERALGVDQIDDCGKRGRLAGAGGSGHEDQSPWLGGHLSNDRRHSEILERCDPIGNGAHHHSQGTPLEEDICAEPAPTCDRVRRVQLEVLLQLLALASRENVVDHGPQLGGT